MWEFVNGCGGLNMLDYGSRTFKSFVLVEVIVALLQSVSLWMVGF